MKRKEWMRMIAFATAVFCACSAQAEGTSSDRGKDVYAREGCAVCHSLQGKGNRRLPLDGLSERLSRDEIRRWIVAPQEMKAGVRKKAYKLSDEELEALIDYLRQPAP